MTNNTSKDKGGEDKEGASQGGTSGLLCKEKYFVFNGYLKERNFRG